MARITDTEAQKLRSQLSASGLAMGEEDIVAEIGYQRMGLTRPDFSDLNHRYAAAVEQFIAQRAPRRNPATQQSAPVATPRQVEFIADLLARRIRNGEGGGFMATDDLVKADGTIDLAAIAQLTKPKASALITSLKGAY